jgi:hypothetical protein
VLWGDEGTVRERLRDGIRELRMTSVVAQIRYPFSPAETVAFFERYFGPLQRAFATLSKDEQSALRADMENLWTQYNRATDGTTRIEAEYLDVAATRA